MDEKTTEINNVPKSLGIPKDMGSAYSDLSLKTPFSTWALSKLWDAIEVERKKEVNI